MNNKKFSFNEDKNAKLKAARGVGFEDVITLLKSGCFICVIDHPNKIKYHNQRCAIVNINDYCYMIPFVENENEVFLKTIIPSRKLTKRYKNEKKI